MLHYLDFWTLDKPRPVKLIPLPLDKLHMKYRSFLAALTFLYAFAARAEDSNVFTCRFLSDPHGFSSLRMKTYFDRVQNQELGKVDLIQNFIVVESTRTKVYQIPLLDNQTYVQIWYSPTLRVDAPLSYTQGGREFKATYSKNSVKNALICRELQ